MTVSSAPASDGGGSAVMASASAASSSARVAVAAEQADRRLDHAQRAHEHRRRRRQLGDPPLDALEPPAAPSTSRAASRARASTAPSSGWRAQTRRRKPRQPRDHRAVLAARQQEVPVALGEPCRPLAVATGEGVVDRFADQTVLVEPDRSAPVQPRRRRRVARVEAMPQQLGEQSVIAIPALLLVERLQEQIAGRQLGEHRLAAAAAGHRVAEVAGELAQHRGGEEELLHCRRLVRSTSSKR
jgi:hypothetical protein